jgi:hypothetical protein
MKKTKNKKNRFSKKNESLISQKNNNRKTRMKKNKVKSRKRARGLSQDQQNLLLDNLRFLSYNHQPLSSILDSISLFDLHSIIKNLTYQIDHNYILPEYIQFNKDLLDTLNFIALQKKSKIDFSPKIPSLTKKNSPDKRIKYNSPNITYSQHALEQMALPKRQISFGTIENIIKNDKYELTDQDKRRIYLSRGDDPNNWLKIITSNNDNPHIITAIRNDPIDSLFTFGALKVIEKNNLDKEDILNLVKKGKPTEFENDKLKFVSKKLSVITDKNRYKILSIRINS